MTAFSICFCKVTIVLQGGGEERKEGDGKEGWMLGRRSLRPSRRTQKNYHFLMKLKIRSTRNHQRNREAKATFKVRGYRLGFY